VKSPPKKNTDDSLNDLLLTPPKLKSKRFSVPKRQANDTNDLLTELTNQITPREKPSTRSSDAKPIDRQSCFTQWDNEATPKPPRRAYYGAKHKPDQLKSEERLSSHGDRPARRERLLVKCDTSLNDMSDMFDDSVCTQDFSSLMSSDDLQTPMQTGKYSTHLVVCFIELHSTFAGFNFYVYMHRTFNSPTVFSSGFVSAFVKRNFTVTH